MSNPADNASNQESGPIPQATTAENAVLNPKAEISTAKPDLVKPKGGHAPRQLKYGFFLTPRPQFVTSLDPKSRGIKKKLTTEAGPKAIRKLKDVDVTENKPDEFSDEMEKEEKRAAETLEEYEEKKPKDPAIQEKFEKWFNRNLERVGESVEKIDTTSPTFNLQELVEKYEKAAKVLKAIQMSIKHAEYPGTTSLVDEEELEFILKYATETGTLKKSAINFDNAKRYTDYETFRDMKMLDFTGKDPIEILRKACNASLNKRGKNATHSSVAEMWNKSKTKIFHVGTMELDMSKFPVIEFDQDAVHFPSNLLFE